MSNKIFDESQQKWIKTSTTLASESKVVDISGNFKSENVEGCLTEIKDEMKDVQNKLQYIYENGTMGGGGGGGSSLPTVKLLSPEYIVTPLDKQVEVLYQFTSPNPGNGTAILTFDTSYTEVSCFQGRTNKWVIGPFESRKEYRCSVAVMDRAGMSSLAETFVIMAGALDISSTFDTDKDYSVADNIVIPYTITSINSDPVSVDITIDGVSRTVQGEINAVNYLEVGTLDVIGLHTVTIQARTSSLESKKLTLSFIVGDANSIFMSSPFDTERFNYGSPINVFFRISKKNYDSFMTRCYVNGELITQLNTESLDNVWQVGTELPVTSELEPHILELVSVPYDGSFNNPDHLSNRLRYEVHIDSDDKPTEIVTKGLIASFSAEGKMNNAADRHIWLAKPASSNIKCTLQNFNYRTNGWQDGALVFNGLSYGRVNLAPFANNIPNGFTAEILYKIENVGDYAAKVIHCKNTLTPFQGFEIDTSEATIRPVAGKIATAMFKEKEWVRQTFVVDRTKKCMIIYTNAVISSIAYLTDVDEFLTDKEIILGAQLNDDGSIERNANCAIKTMRFYDVALTHEEVLQNHISDYPIEMQQILKEMNYGQDIPDIKITGDMTNIDNEESEKPVQFVYTDPKNPLKGKTFTCKISIQGTSSKSYPVQNYTAKLFEGNAPNDSWTPNNDWLPEMRYTLKADFMESSHANNVGTAKFVHDFFKDSYYANHAYPSFSTDPLHRACIDGFPVKMHINGDFKGIYMFNIDRYAHNTYGYIGESKCVSYEVGVNSTLGAGAFADDSWQSISSEFRYRYSYHGDISVVTEKTDKNEVVLKSGYHNELQRLVTWVKNCTVDEFRVDVDKYFSRRHLIDYYLIVYVLGLIDSLGKNMVLTTWGPNENLDTIWYPSFYDMDTMLGLTNDGKREYGPDVDVNGKFPGQDGSYNTSNSFLWVKLREAYGNEISSRYQDLRKTYFTAENLIKYYEEGVMNQIGQIRYNQDAYEKYINLPEDKRDAYSYCCQGTRMEYTRRWLEERFIYLDTVFRTDEFLRIKGIIRTNTKENLKLGLRAHSPQWVEISWSNNALHRSVVYIDKWNHADKDGIYWIDGGKPSNWTENNVDINGIRGVMYMYGLENLEVSTMLLSEAHKLVEIDCGSSKHLKQLELGSNKLLQKVNARNCENLGTSLDPQGKQLNVSECINLKHLDLSNTKLSNVTFPADGGALTYLDMTNARITTFRLTGQEYLTELKLSGCRDLSRFYMEGCNSMKKVEMPNSKLQKVDIISCDALEILDISKTGFLDHLNITKTTNIKKLNLSNLTGDKLKEINLVFCENLVDLNLSNSSYIQKITFPSTFNSLKVLNCESSGIQSFKYGINAAYPDYLDIGNGNRIKLEFMTFKNCSSLVEIRNCSYRAGFKPDANGNPTSTRYSSESIFYNCRKLRTIHGSLTLEGSLSNSFTHCHELINLPATFNLSGVTGGSYIFTDCRKFTWQTVKSILDKCTSITSTNEMFSSCPGITGAIPANLFAKAVNITTLSEMFSGCINISGEIPRTLLHPLKNLTSGYYGFNGCSKITGVVPNELFQIMRTDGTNQATKISNIEYMFNGCSGLTGLEPDVLKNMTSLSNARCFLNGCSNIESQVSPTFFRSCTNLVYANNFFGACSKLYGPIPNGLFHGCKKLREVQSFFSGCKGLTGAVPKIIFNGLYDEEKKEWSGPSTSLQYVNSFFNGCSGLTGDVSSELFAQCPNIISVSHLFANCVDIGPDIPDIIRGKKLLTDATNLYYGCKGFYGTIPSFETTIEKEIEIEYVYDEFGDLVPTEVEVFYEITKSILDGCTGLLKAGGLFHGCINISGEIPSGLLYSTGNLTHVNSLFQDCRALMSPIPPRLFKNCKNVMDMSKIFYYCERLYGGIPKQLFNNCTSLTDLNYAFYACFGLCEPENAGGGLEANKPPIIPKDLFKTTRRLQNLSYAFNWNGLKGKLDKDTFYECGPALNNVAHMFAHTRVTGPLHEDTFMRNTGITSFSHTFYNADIRSIGATLFNRSALVTSFDSCFYGCGSMTGDYIKTWQLRPGATHARIYAGCTKLNGFDEMPSAYK